MKLRVLVTGCPRSGTSMFARLLHCSGINMGERFYPPVNPVNPMGVFEDIELCETNMAMIRESIGRPVPRCLHYGFPAKSPDIRYNDTPVTQRMLRYKLEDYGAVGFKDPWVTVTWDTWRQVIHPSTVVFLLRRDRDAVIDSYVNNLCGLPGAGSRDDYGLIYDWFGRQMDRITREWDHVEHIEYIDICEPDRQHIVSAILKKHFPGHWWNYGMIIPDHQRRMGLQPIGGTVT